jgi:hypothetical protein
MCQGATRWLAVLPFYLIAHIISSICPFSCSFYFCTSCRAKYIIPRVFNNHFLNWIVAGYITRGPDDTCAPAGMVSRGEMVLAEWRGDFLSRGVYY